MKKFLLIALFLPIGLISYAQNIELITPYTSVNGNLEDETYIKLHIKNNSSGSLSLIVKRTENNLVAGQQSYFCIGELCYGPGTSISTKTINIDMTGDEDSSFKGYVKAYGNMGTSVVKYCFVDQFTADSSCITFTYNMGTTGVIKNSHHVFIKTFPNPASDEVNVVFNSEKTYSDIRIAIYDISGRKISETAAVPTADMIKINTENLTNGLYLISLVADGTVIANEKLAVAR